MNPNLTFFVQIIHFIIAYIIIEKFFLRPLLQLINKEKHYYDELINTIHKHQQLLKAKEELKITEWRNIKHFFATIIPKRIAKLFPPYKQLEIPPMNEKEMQKTVQELKTFLIKRLSNVS